MRVQTKLGHKAQRVPNPQEPPPIQPLQQPSKSIGFVILYQPPHLQPPLSPKIQAQQLFGIRAGTGKGVNVDFLTSIISAPMKSTMELIIKSVAPESNITRKISFGTTFTPIQKLTNGVLPLIGGTPNIFLSTVNFQRNQGGSYATDTAWATLIANNLASTAPYMGSSKNITNPALPQASGAHNVNLFLVIPAGDDKVACNTATSSASIKDCNLVGGILAKKRETEINAGDRVLFVGALTDDDGVSSTPDTMASYSVQAGEELKYDFIVAHDDIHIAGDASKTEYAAARIAGAAALLRHKFPSLDGATLKQVLTQTADDLGTTGPDPIFGMGELNLGKALSPVGNMVTR